MKHPRHGERGAALVMFIGLAAALGLLSTVLVFAILNATSNTARDQHTTKAFGVAEAALDVTMEELASSWPRTELRAYETWTETDRPTFAAAVLGAASPAPRADGLPYADVRVFDDPIDPTVNQEDGWEAGMPNWDANHNGIVYVDSQARVQDRAVRIRATVAADYYPLPLSKVVAIWAENALASTGSGNDANVTAEVLYDEKATIHLGAYGSGTTSLWDPALFTPDTTAGAPPLSQDRVEELVQIAKEMDRYFSGVNAVTQMKTVLAGEDPGPWEGLIVLDFRQSGVTPTVRIDPGNYNCTVQNNGDQTVVTGYDDPGALLILGGNLQLAGNIDYYGLVYVEGNVGADAASKAAGKPVIHGMLYCVENPVTHEGGSIDLKGNACVRFNANAARYLGSEFVTAVQLVDNGWRELQPTSWPTP